MKKKKRKKGSSTPSVPRSLADGPGRHRRTWERLLPARVTAGQHGDTSVAPGPAASSPALGSQLPAQGRAVPGHPGSFAGHTGRAGLAAALWGHVPRQQQPPRTLPGALGSLRPAQPFPSREEKTPQVSGGQILLTQLPGVHKGKATRLMHRRVNFHHRSHPAVHQD